MEPASLSIGLVGVIQPLIHLSGIVKAYRSFAPDSDALNAQFEAERLRFERWICGVGPDKGQLLADHQARSVVEDLLSVIDNILETKENIYQIWGAKSGPLNKATSGTVNQRHTREGDTGSKRRKLVWALGRKQHFTDLVTRFGKVVQQLHDLVPPDQAASTRSTTGNGSHEPLQGADPQSNVPGTTTEFERGLQAEFCQTLVELRQALAEAQGEYTDTRREIHSWLLGQHSPNERYDDSCTKRLTGTCDWILKRPAFTRWSAPDLPSGTPEILWIHGRPGFGKTILASRIVDHLSAVPDKPVAHFFFSSDHDSRNDPYIVMRSWVSQLASQPEVFALVYPRWTTTKDQVATRATVTQLLREALQARPDCYLVVDGLDECTAPIDSSNSVARFLEDVKSAIRPTTRVLIVSREESKIRQALRTDDPNRLAEYQISSGDVHADATAFARSIVDRKLPKKSEHDKDSLSKIMTDRCEGQFLWLRMQEQNLKSWKNLGQLQSALESTPTGLDYIYKRNWDRIEHSDRAVALLRWAAFALRTLTINEITEAVLIDEDCEALPTHELPDVIDEEYIGTEILEFCGPLLEVRRSHPVSAAGDQTVHLAHFTVREFLVRHLPAGGIWQNENLRASNERIQHTILARSCLWYVQSRQSWQIGSDTHESPFQAALRDYSAASWHAHVKSGVPLEQDSDTLKRILEFMNEAQPCWDAWRTWLDVHDEEEREEAGDEEIPPGPSYYAVKLGLNAVAAHHIQKFGPGQNVNCAGRSVLDLCCAQGNFELVEKILDAGVDIEAKSGVGRTPLYSASRYGRSWLVQLLLDRGAQVHVTNLDGWTPVNIAADGGHTEVVKLLVEKGADITLANDDGWTPVNAAADNGHLEV
ncbi:hypothetical protein C8A03DRAFT_39490, partial [Achaetomium macrosporum]